MGVLQGSPHVPVAVLIERIQVHSHRSGEQDGILWNDGQPGAELA